MGTVLDRFSPATREWFSGAFAAPTPAQLGAWEAVSTGANALVIAPTGSGKTLAAFLWSIDRLISSPPMTSLAGSLGAGTGATRRNPAESLRDSHSSRAPEDPRQRTRVLYISPLKALGVDVERNLRAPLVGVTQTAKRLGLPAPEVTVGVRSGDTSTQDRRLLARTPPDILITTPESLYLMLTSAARETLLGVETIIVDEVHAVAATKRGAHLAVSLERLDALLPKPAQRIGLSATVRPAEEVARFLGGSAPVTIVSPPASKTFDLRVVVPVEDMTELGTAAPLEGSAASNAPQGSIWPHVEESIVDLILEHRSTIVFANSRRLAERLTARLNEIYEERAVEAETGEAHADGGFPRSQAPSALASQNRWRDSHSSSSPAQMMAQAGSTRGSRRIRAEQAERSGAVDQTSLAGSVGARTGATRRDPAEPLRDSPSSTARGSVGIFGQAGLVDSLATSPLLARAHHGSVSKDQRAIIEDDLKSGRLRCVVATSSLELGIDMGAVDLVVQVESPPSVASGLQRIGRAGHQVGEISKGVMFPKHRADLLHTAVASERMLAGLIEELKVPANPLDILAQQTVAAVALGPIDIEEWFETLRRSAPFANLPRSAYTATLDLLSGLYPSDEFAELRPRIVWDRVTGTLTGRPGAQRLAVTSGGTIPDRGLFGVFMVGEKASRVGELDEEMVYESRVGDVFALGATSWRIEDITHDRVIVSPAFGQPGKVPFWKGDGLGRPAELGRAIGAFAREIAGASPAKTREGAAESGESRAVALRQPRQPVGEAPPSQAQSALVSQNRWRDSPSSSVPRAEGASDRGAAGTPEAAPRHSVRERLEAAGLDEKAINNLLTFVADQKASTGHVPTDTTLVVERFRDELGDWRVILHSPYGMPVHAPWALAVGARVRDRLGVDGAAIASDDGVIVRIPDTDAAPPGAELFVFEPDELQQTVTEEVGGSALFASRFRECAARALLLPRYNPGKRSPLWQQRQRASQLLDVARKYPSFPIILETVREVLQDAYDLPALAQLTQEIADRRIRIVETETEVPSPYARSLLFGYVAAFMYEGDSPLAERRAAALSLDSTLLAELLGRAELRELLDAGVIEQTEMELQRLVADRKARDAEGIVDLLRLLGPLTVEEVAERFAGGTTGAGAVAGTAPDASAETTVVPTFAGAEVDQPAKVGKTTVASPATPAPTTDEMPLSAETPGVIPAETGISQPPEPDPNSGPGPGPHPSTALITTMLDQLARANRVLPAIIAGQPRWAVIEDAARLRDALGVPLPIGVPAAFIEPVADPLGDLVARYARTHGPFTVLAVAERFGLGTAVVSDTLRRLGSERRVVEGEFRPGSSGSEWCDSEVLRRLRSRSLAALRREVEPVDAATLGRFLPAWQSVGSSLTGVDGLAQVVDQLSGVALPASAWETLVLPARLRNYSQAWLDELTLSGEVVWSGVGSLPGNDGWVSLHLAESAPFTLAEPTGEETTELQRSILASLAGGGAFFFRQLSNAIGSTLETSVDDQELTTALWDLVWSGLVTNDTFAPLRFHLGGKAKPKLPRTRSYRGRARMAMPSQAGPPSVGGRWSLLPLAEADTTVRAKATAELLLERHGVVTRGAVVTEGIRGGFSLMYRVLSGFEESGRARRGYFVEGLGAAQFATGATVDRLRSFSREGAMDEPPLAGVALAATDPANPYGAALPWPSLEAEPDSPRGHRPGRKAGAIVVIVDGSLVLYVERGGKTVLTFGAADGALAVAAMALATAIRRSLGNLRVERVDGEFVIGTTLGAALIDAGFSSTPQGLRLRG